MDRKAEKRDRDFRNLVGHIGMRGVPARINRHTGKPHEHAREIARNLRKAAA